MVCGPIWGAEVKTNKWKKCFVQGLGLGASLHILSKSWNPQAEPTVVSNGEGVQIFGLRPRLDALPPPSHLPSSPPRDETWLIALKYLALPTLDYRTKQGSQHQHLLHEKFRNRLSPPTVLFWCEFDHCPFHNVAALIKRNPLSFYPCLRMGGWPV